MARKLLNAALCSLVLMSFLPHTHASPGAPHITRLSLLNGITLNYQTGSFHIEDLIITSLPDPKNTSDSKFKYNPEDGGKLYAALINGKGDEIGRFDFYAEKIKDDSWKIADYKLTQKVLGKTVTDRSYITIKQGEYKLVFYVDGEKFYTFPFQVELKQDKDPIAPEDIHTLDGPWNDMGYLNSANQKLKWYMWLRDKNDDKKEVTAYIELFQDQNLIASSNKDATYRLSPEWTSLNFDLNKPDTNSPLTMQEFIKKDGIYTLQAVVADKPYAIWDIEVTDGKLTQKAAPSTDSLSNIVWYKRNST